MADFYERRSRKRRAILELVVLEEPTYYRKRSRRIFEACRENGFGVMGYKEQLEAALKLVDRAVAAINAVEGNQ